MNKEQLITELGQALASMNYSTVENLAAEALKNFPEETFGYRFLADALLKRTSVPYSSVEMCLIKLIQLNENDTEAILKFAQVKEKQGAIEEAMRAYKNIIVKDRTNIQALLSVADYELFALNNPEQALVYLDAAVEAHPNDVHARCLRAHAYKALKRFGDAVQDIDPIIMNGFNEEAYNLKVEILNELNRPGATLVLLKALVQHKPENFSYRYHYGRNLLTFGDAVAATEQIQKAIENIDNAGDDLYALLSEALSAQGRFAEAENAIQKAIELAPSMFSYKVDRLRIMGQSKRTEEALAYCESLVGQDETFNNMLLIEKAVLLSVAGRWDEAEQLYMQLLQTKGQEKKGSYGLGLCAMNEGNVEKAYFYMHNAELRGHENAAAYIRENLAGYLMMVRQKLLTANEENIKANATNETLKPLFGKLWHFEDVNSKSLESAPEFMKHIVMEELRKRVVFLTEKGALITAGSGNVVAYTYKIAADHGKGIIDLELIPLDGLRHFIIRLQMSPKGLVYSQEAGEYLLLQTRTLDALPEGLAKHLNSKIHSDDANFLGDAVKPLLKAINV